MVCLPAFTARAGRLLCLVLLLVPAMAARSQSSSSQDPTSQQFPQQNNTSTQPRGRHSPPPDLDSMFPPGKNDPFREEIRTQQLNVARHKSMVADTDKLMQLATELNNQVGSANPATYTQAQLKMLSEIEKLAKSVKEKMRIAGTGQSPWLDATPPPPTMPR